MLMKLDLGSLKVAGDPGAQEPLIVIGYPN